MTPWLWFQWGCSCNGRGVQGARRATGTQRPLQDRTQGEVESSLQVKGVEGGAGLAQLFLGGGTHVGTGQEPVAGCHRAIMAAFDFRAMAVLAQEFGRGAEVFVERFPDVP